MTSFWEHFLDKFCFSINYDDHTVKWVDYIIPLKDSHEFFGPNMLTDLNDQLCQDKEEEIFEHHLLDNYSARILDTKYEQVDINTVAAAQKRLTPNQHHDLQVILAKYKNLFDGSLGVYTHKKIHIDHLPGLQLVHNLVGNVPDMSQTCPRDGDMSKNPRDRIRWPAIFFSFFAQSRVRRVSSE